MKQAAAKTEGKVTMPGVIFGTVSAVLGLATEVLGVFRGLESGLAAFYEARGFALTSELGLLSLPGGFLVLLAGFGISAMILSAPETWRRVMLGVTALVLVLMLSPVLAVWGIFWHPGALLLASVWAWLSSLLYAEKHRMPCDGEEARESRENVIPMRREKKEGSARAERREKS
ncbi:MAG: hypothetical protein ACQKBY_07120 [Verrucomicrobiales bacterium]